MGLINFTYHNCKFDIDTMDWCDAASADQCADLIGSHVEDWGETKTRAVHSLMLRDQDNGDLSAGERALLDEVWQMTADQATEVMKDWKNTRNLTGHNHELIAVSETA